MYHVYMHALGNCTLQAKLTSEAKQNVQAVFSGEPSVEKLYYAISAIAHTGKESKLVSLVLHA